MNERLRLKQVTISAFRGVRDPIVVQLGTPLVVIYGPNGSGKSTILTAIEWALYPRESCLLEHHGIDERRGWKVEHYHSEQKPCVKLILSAGDKTVEIVSNQEASQRPVTIRCTYADFKSVVFVHQETIRDFLVGRPKTREDMFKRLFGGWVLDLKGCIDNAYFEVKKKREEADQQVDALDKKLEDRLNEARRLQKEAEEEVRQLGLRPPWDQAASQVIDEINRQLAGLAKELGLSSPAPLRFESWSQFDEQLDKVDEALKKELESKKQHNELSTRKVELESALSAYRQAVQQLEKADKDLKERCDKLAREVGTGTESITRDELKTVLAKRIKDIDSRVAEIKNRLSQLNMKRELLNNALKLLEAEPAIEECPVCDQRIRPQDLVQKLRQKTEANLTHEESRLRSRKQELETEKTKLGGYLNQLQNLEQNVQREQGLVQQKRNDLETKIGKQFLPNEDPSAVSQSQIQLIEMELERIKQSQQQITERIRTIKDWAKERLQPLDNLVKREQRLTQLQQLREKPAWQRMLEVQKQLARKEQTWKRFSMILDKLAGETARQRLQPAAGTISNYYRRLTQRSDFPELVVDPERKYEVSVVGQNDKDRQVVTAILNLTDLNSAALATIMGVAVTFPEDHDLDFLILDDPSQGMDANVAKRLADLIADLTEKKQVIVATADADLFEKLRNCGVIKTVVQLKPRDAKELQPCVQVESVE
jgi:exonuclease SbcC